MSNSQPRASVNSVTISAGSGNDTLLIDELISLSGGVTFNGGAQSGPPGDAIIVQAGALSGAEVTYTNATDGRMVFTTGATTAVYNFTGIDPLDMTGSTATNLVFNLPGGTDTQLEDDGISGNNVSQLRDANAMPGFDTTAFAHPTGSLTINGTATDNVNVNLVDNLGAPTLTINANIITVAEIAAGPFVTLRADDIVLLGDVNATSLGAVVLTSYSAPREIDVGTDTAGTLGLTDAELDLVIAGVISIGDQAHTGAITISSQINPTTAQNLNSGTTLVASRSAQM